MNNVANSHSQIIKQPSKGEYDQIYTKILSDCILLGWKNSHPISIIYNSGTEWNQIVPIFLVLVEFMLNKDKRWKSWKIEINSAKKNSYIKKMEMGK